jgi:hypothetical protein
MVKDGKPGAIRDQRGPLKHQQIHAAQRWLDTGMASNFEGEGIG